MSIMPESSRVPRNPAVPFRGFDQAWDGGLAALVQMGEAQHRRDQPLPRRLAQQRFGSQLIARAAALESEQCQIVLRSRVPLIG